MERKRMIYWGVGIAVVLGLFFSFGLVGNGPVDEVQTPANTAPIPAPAPVVPTVDNSPVNYATYNYDFVDENVKSILNRQLGSQGKTAFYLPRTGYINVTRGTKYGVAYALNNPNPSGENYFEYHWNVDPSVVANCDVSVVDAQKWIERGWMSWGKIGEGWIDHMTVYFSFPGDVKACNVKYNFVITKDGAAYDSKTLEFNLI